MKEVVLTMVNNAVAGVREVITRAHDTRYMPSGSASPKVDFSAVSCDGDDIWETVDGVESLEAVHQRAIDSWLFQLEVRPASSLCATGSFMHMLFGKYMIRKLFTVREEDMEAVCGEELLIARECTHVDSHVHDANDARAVKTSYNRGSCLGELIIEVTAVRGELPVGRHLGVGGGHGVRFKFLSPFSQPQSLGKSVSGRFVPTLDKDKAQVVAFSSIYVHVQHALVHSLILQA